MHFNENLLTLRRRDNLSQEELAEKLGVTRQAVSKWESAQSAPDIDKIAELCKIFNVSADSLLGLSAASYPSSAEILAVQSKRQNFKELTTSLFWLLLFLAGYILFMFLIFGPTFDNGLYLFSLALMFIPFVIFSVRTLVPLFKKLFKKIFSK